jgi:hypothetical protein
VGAAAAGGVTAATQVLSSKLQADAMVAQGEWQNQQLQFNAETMAMQRREIGKKAQEDINYRQRDVSAMLGMQKVTLAASGIDVDSDLSQQLQADTRKTGREDVAAIQNNAWREAWGMDVKIADTRTQAAFAKAGAYTNAANTIATGGLQGVSSITSGMAQQIRDDRR